MIFCLQNNYLFKLFAKTIKIIFNLKKMYLLLCCTTGYSFSLYLSWLSQSCKQIVWWYLYHYLDHIVQPRSHNVFTKHSFNDVWKSCFHYPSLTLYPLLFPFEKIFWLLCDLFIAYLVILRWNNGRISFYFDYMFNLSLV